MVEDPAGIVRVGDPIADAAASGVPASGVPASGDPAIGTATSVDPAAGPLPLAATVSDPFAPEVGIAGIVLAGIASLAVTFLRRQRTRRRLTARVAARLESLVGGRSTPALAAPLAVPAATPANRSGGPSSSGSGR
jgi:hypothetical protein